MTQNVVCVVIVLGCSSNSIWLFPHCQLGCVVSTNETRRPDPAGKDGVTETPAAGTPPSPCGHYGLEEIFHKCHKIASSVTVLL